MVEKQKNTPEKALYYKAISGVGVKLQNVAFRPGR